MNGSRLHATAAQRGYTLVELMAAMVITLFVMAGVYTLMLQNQRTYEQQSQLADAQQAARVAIDLMTREIRMAGADPSGRAFSPATVCLDGDYATPASAASPAPGTLAALTVAAVSAIRVKMDRPVWGLAAETLTSPPPVPSPYPKQDCSAPVDNDYNDDDEDWLGDGFINDEAEDVEYVWNSGTKILTRNEYIAYPAAACVGCSDGVPAAGTYAIPIAENIVDLKFKYYDTEPPNAPCPTGVYATQALYEDARDACDPPLATPTPADFSAVRRVRIVLVVETEKRDPINPAGGTNKLTLTSQATIRNRR